MSKTFEAPVLYIDKAVMLPDKGQWTNRFNIPSESEDSLYTIAQHKTGKWWGCDCFGWIRHKHCKHLKACGIPGNHTPYEPKIIDQ